MQVSLHKGTGDSFQIEVAHLQRLRFVDGMVEPEPSIKRDLDSEDLVVFFWLIYANKNPMHKLSRKLRLPHLFLD